MAVALALETPSDDVIGWQLAEMSFTPTWQTVGGRVRVSLSPSYPLAKKPVQRRIAHGAKLLGLDVPDRTAAASTLRGAKRRAEAAYAAHERRLRKVVRDGIDPESDVKLIMLTSECWRTAGEVAQAMPLERWDKSAFLRRYKPAEDPSERAHELALAAKAQDARSRIMANLMRERLEGRRCLADSLRASAATLAPLVDLRDTPRKVELLNGECAPPPSVEAWLRTMQAADLADLLSPDAVTRQDVLGRKPIIFDDELTAGRSGARRRRGAEAGALASENWTRAIERAADQAAR